MNQSNFLQTLQEIDENLPDVFFDKLFAHPVLSKSFLEFPYMPSAKLIQKINDSFTNLSFQLYPKTETEDTEALLAAFFNLNTDKDVIVGNGGFYLLNLLVRMISLKKNARILLLSPDFFYFKRILSQYNLPFKEYVYSNFEIDIDELCETIKEFQPDLILMSNPNNPSSKALCTDAIKKILDASTGLVVIDEIYVDFAKQSMMPLLPQYDNLLILRSFSKIGFAAIRFGFFCGNPNIIKILKKLREPFSVNSLTLEVAKLAIKNFNLIQESINEFIQLREDMINELRKIEHINVIPSDTNFIVTEINEKFPLLKIYDQLINMQVVVRHYPLLQKTKNYLRLSVLTPEINQHAVTCLSHIFLEENQIIMSQ